MEKLILDGKLVADRIKEQLAKRIQTLSQKGVTPCLATILVGDDPSSATYVRMKGSACKRLRITSVRVDLLADTALIREARALAEVLLADDPHLDRHPELKDSVAELAMGDRA